MSCVEVVVCDAVHVQRHGSLVEHTLVVALHCVGRCRVDACRDGRDDGCTSLWYGVDVYRDNTRHETVYGDSQQQTKLSWMWEIELKR